jgi:hypothetical protein
MVFSKTLQPGLAFLGVGMRTNFEAAQQLMNCNFLGRTWQKLLVIATSYDCAPRRGFEMRWLNRPISAYAFPRRALTLCPQLRMGIHPDGRLPARRADADALPATQYRHFTPVISKSAY